MSEVAIMSSDDRERIIYIPLSKTDELPDNIMDDGEEFTVVLQGRMKALTQRKGDLEDWEDPGEIKLLVEGVKIEGKNVFTELAESD